MSEIEKIQRYVARTKKFPEGTPYQMNLLEAFSLADMSHEAAIDAICIAFEYGRAKGYRAAKAEEKARVAAVQKNTAPGIRSTGGGKGGTGFETAFSASDDTI